MSRKMLLVSALFAALHAGVRDDVRVVAAAGDDLKTHASAKTGSGIAPHDARTPGARTDWTTIPLGNFPNSFALRNALDAASCGVGDLAQEIIARPAFTLAPAGTAVDLVAVSPAGLGLTGESAALGDIYSRAQEFGLRLAPADVGPELRLQ